jgi:hypothetical protein
VYFSTSRNVSYPRLDRPLLALGLEGSANKLGAGIIKHLEDGSSAVLSNVRHTYITPPGEGFQPRDTANHHREWIIKVINDCLATAGVSLHDVDCICYTKGSRSVDLWLSRISSSKVLEWVLHCSLWHWLLERFPSCSISPSSV